MRRKRYYECLRAILRVVLEKRVEIPEKCVKRNHIKKRRKIKKIKFLDEVSLLKPYRKPES